MRYNRMAMDERETLQIDRILGQFAAFCLTPRGRKSLLESNFLSKDELADALLGVQEMFQTLSRYGAPPIDSPVDLRDEVDMAKKGKVLSGEELKAVEREHLASISYKAFVEAMENAPYARKTAESMGDFSLAAQEIGRCVDSDFSLFDKASPELRSIRNSIRSAERSIALRLPKLIDEYRSFLTSPTLTLRDGHYALPVAIAYKSKVPGNVLGYSGSGGSLFVEPAPLVALNARLLSLRGEEKNEEERIRRRLSGLVGEAGEEIEKTNLAFASEDIRLAKARWMESHEGHVASIGEEIHLPFARHPLLDAKKAVPNSFRLTRDSRLLVISGPNAGGKTVALKTVGVCAYLFMLGFPLPCAQGAILPYFGVIRSDIGDHQSIDDNLSTFSGHIAEIASCLEGIGPSSLLLLDEVGTGTSPHEGETLAIAILDKVLSSDCFALASSHFEGVKEFALSRPGAGNASMEFDSDSLEPTYHLRLGVPGESYALVLSERFGLSRDIVERAKALAEKGKDASVSTTIEKLSALLKENEDLRLALSKKEGELSSELARLEKERKAFEKEKEEFAASIRQKEEEAMEKASRAAEMAIKRLSSPSLKLHQAIEEKKRLDELLYKEGEKTDETPTEELKVGDYVASADYPVEGTITRINGKKAEISSAKGMSFTLPLSGLRLSKAPKRIESSFRGAGLDGLAKEKGLSLECNLIGLRYDEARQALDAYLDKCRVKGFKRVRIIHGLGSGALKRMTAEYAASHSFVDHLEMAGEGEGGAGASVLVLK